MKKVLLAILLAASIISFSQNNNFNMRNNSSDDKTEIKIDSLISKMTLEEKISMIHGNSSFTAGGVSRLGIPELVMSDGPHGVREEIGRDWKPAGRNDDFSTYLPTGTALASTWNTELAYLFGSVLGSEANYRGKDVILGPGINIIRTPLNGRNFEYMSEDPYLISKLVVQDIKGIQDQGISACVKHFACNNQELYRGKINVVMNERTLREIYLPGFQAAVEDAHVNTIMAAYNKLNGQFCAQNEYLLKKILKGEWKFDGVVISDWGAVHDTYEAAVNGCDLEMGSEFLVGKNYDKFFLGHPLLKLVEQGKINEEVVNDKVRRLLRIMYRTNVFGKRIHGSYDTKEHQEIARKIAEEAIVLLKNKNNILPLNSSQVKSIAVIGENADKKQAYSGGSSAIKALYEITPLEGLKNLTGGKVKLNYSLGYSSDKDKNENYAQLIEDAVATAKQSDVVILFCGLIHGYSRNLRDGEYDAESVDKPDMKLPFHQTELINAVVKANPKTMVVLVDGGPVEMPWIEDVQAILQGWYSGMESGNAMAEIIFGKINPSGKLPVTFPKKLEDSPAHAIGEYPGDGKTVNYKEGILVGYRYFDTKNVEPLFCFGHGLSYTQFKYSNLKITPENASPSDIITVSVDIENTGQMEGKETAQLYVRDVESSVMRPFKELKGFKKTDIKAGEKQTVTFSLTKKDLSFYDENKKDWVAEPGKFEILMGSSSKDIRLTGSFNLK